MEFGFNPGGYGASDSKDLLWEIYSPNISYPVEILHEDAATIDSAILGTKIASIEYSTDDGTVWQSPSFPITVAANDTTKWRISAFNSTYTDGTFILKGTKT